MKAHRKFLLFGLALAALASACSQGQDSPSPTGDRRALVENDITTLATLDTAGLAWVDAQFNGAATEIFGGTSGSNVSTYFQSRVSEIMMPEDETQITVTRVPEDAKTYSNWNKIPAPLLQRFPNPVPANGGGNSQIQLGAANTGFQLWFQSLLDGVQFSLHFPNGDDVTLDPVHHGIMLVGEGYQKEQKAQNGTVVELPPEYRQAILLHEARHSDCTGGLRPSDLDVGRAATSAQDFDTKFKARSCGHMHVICKSGTYKGLYACDAQAWEAYSIGGIFALAMFHNQTDTQKRQIMKMTAVDSLSRLQGVSPDAMLGGQLGTPDMSSSGMQPEQPPDPQPRHGEQ